MQREGTVPKLRICLPSFNKKRSLAGKERRWRGWAGNNNVKGSAKRGGLRSPFEDSSSKTGAGNICNETIHDKKLLRP